jgi:hypothetical protein
MEPAVGMIRQDRTLPWVRGDAEFLAVQGRLVRRRVRDVGVLLLEGLGSHAGIDELHRVVTAGGPLVIVDNLDGDDFSDERRAQHVGSGVLGARKGFEVEEIETAFAFDTHEQADRLLGFYFGDAGCGTGKLEFFYRVGVYVGPSQGSDR